MDRLEHMAYLADSGRRNMTEDVAVEMHHAALPTGLGQVLGGAFRQPPAGIRDNQLDAFKPAIDQVPQEG